MSNVERAGQVAGTWLAIASLLIIATLVLHGPISPDLTDQMRRIADGPMRWVWAHWIAAASLSLYAVAGLVVLASGSRLTETWWTLTAWAVMPVGSIWTLTTAVAEATAVTNAAVSGNIEMFEMWWVFAEGKANGFAFVALAIAVIAGNEARGPSLPPPGGPLGLPQSRPLRLSWDGLWGCGSTSASEASSGWRRQSS